MRRKPLNPDAAQAEGVDYLLREFKALRTSVASGTGAAATGKAGPIEATYLVAASDSRTAISERADYRCDGVSDQEEYAAAATALYDAGSAVGGILQLTAGTFACSDYLPTDASQKNFWIRGAGLKSTIIASDSATPTADRSGFIYVDGDHCKVTDLSIVVDDDQYLSAVRIGGDYWSLVSRVHVQIIPDVTEANLRGGIWIGDDTIVEDCWVDAFSEGTGIVVDGDRCLVTGCMVENATTQGLLDGDGIVVLDGREDARIIGNTVATSGFGTIAGAGIRIHADRAIVIGNVCPDGIIIESTADGTIIGGNTGTITDNGTNTVFLDNSQIAADVENVVFTRTGTLFDATTGTTRVYTKTARTITSCFAAVAGTPVTNPAVFDVHLDGTTIYTTQANRPDVAATAYVGDAEVPDVTAWAADSYLTVDVDTASSATDLTLTVQYTEA